VIGAPVFADVQHHRAPFPCFTSERALSDEQLAWLEALYDEPLAWQHHRDAFYRASLSDVSERLPEPFRRAVLEAMRAATGLPLIDRVQLTVQRMAPGEYAGPHTDRPLVGFEAARLIVQLGPDWRPGDGGSFDLHPDPDGERTVLSRPPRRNAGFGFVMGPASYHSVQPVVRERRTAVFNCWHVGNTEGVAAWVAEELEDLHFGDLPGALEPVAAQAEPSLPEEQTHRAGCVAWLMQRWGFSVDEVVAGYREALEPRSQGVVALARWVVRLSTEDFDVAAWGRLSTSLPVDPRVDRVVSALFPGARTAVGTPGGSTPPR